MKGPGARPGGTAWILTGERMPVSHPAGPELRRQWLGACLSEFGYEPIVFASGRRVGRAARKRSGPPARAGAGPPSRGTARAFLDAATSLGSAPWLALLAVRDRPEIVTTTTALAAPALLLVKLLLRDRTVAVADVIGLRSLEAEQTARLRLVRPVYRRAWLILERLLFSRADVVLVINDRHAELVRQRHGVREVHTVRDAAEANHSSPPADLVAFGVPSDAVAVAFVGSLICSRMDPILDAWEKLTGGHGEDGRPALSLVVVGDGPDLPACQRRAAASGWLGRSVFFLGPLPRQQALAVVRACDIAYSDCWSEAGFPSKLFEYLALGTPIVVSGKRQMSEVLTDGRDALFFQTPDELAGRLRLLAERPELRAELGRAARKTFLAGNTYADRRRDFSRALARAVGDGTARSRKGPTP